MQKVAAEISMSLDGYVAGPGQTLRDPLGAGGEQLHQWAFRLEAWRRPHGMEGGETGPESALVEETLRSTGAVVMGRRMYSGGEGRWEDDANGGGWWGDEPPFGVPVFVVTHHARERVDKLGGTSFTFVTDGVESAVARARAAAGERNVAIAGGATVVQQCLAAGLLDEITVHVAPVLLGDGVRLFESAAPRRLEIVQTVATPQATHVRYRLAH
jgi:dihydrofolate reductase